METIFVLFKEKEIEILKIKEVDLNVNKRSFKDLISAQLRIYLKKMFIKVF